MKTLITVVGILFCSTILAQTTIVRADTIDAKKGIKLAGRKIIAIKNDSTALDSNKLLTAKAVKDFVTGRVDLKLDKTGKTVNTTTLERIDFINSNTLGSTAIYMGTSAAARKGGYLYYDGDDVSVLGNLAFNVVADSASSELHLRTLNSGSPIKMSINGVTKFNLKDTSLDFSVPVYGITPTIGDSTNKFATTKFLQQELADGKSLVKAPFKIIHDNVYDKDTLAYIPVIPGMLLVGSGDSIPEPSEIFYNSSTKKIALGHTSPSYDFDLRKTFDGNYGIGIQNESNGSSGAAVFDFGRSYAAEMYSRFYFAGDGNGFYTPLSLNIINQSGATGGMFLNNIANAPMNFLTQNVQRFQINGAGDVIVGGGTVAPEFRIREASGSGTNYAGFKTPALAGNTVYTMPAAFPAGNNYLLNSSTAGVLGYTDPAALAYVPMPATVGVAGNMIHTTSNKSTTFEAAPGNAYNLASVAVPETVDLVGGVDGALIYLYYETVGVDVWTVVTAYTLKDGTTSTALAAGKTYIFRFDGANSKWREINN